MAMRPYAKVRLQCIAVGLLSRRAIFVAPIAALALGVWAEFADLNPPALFAVALPAIIVSTVSAAYALRSTARPVLLLLLGVALGTVVFAITEGTYLAVHYSRGGTLDFESVDSQPAMALALLGIHVAVGALVGAGVGAGLAVLAIAGRLLGRRSEVLS